MVGEDAGADCATTVQSPQAAPLHSGQTVRRGWAPRSKSGRGGALSSVTNICSDRNAVQIICKGDDFCAGVKDNAAHPFLSGCGCQSLQAADIIAAQRCGCLDLDPCELASA